MPEITIPPGVSRGATPAERPGRWYDSNLVRWRDGRLQPVGGWARITRVQMASAARRIFAWRDNIDVRRAAVGTDTQLLLLDGSDPINITPSGFQPLAQVVGLPDGFGIGDFGQWDYGAPRPQGSIAYLRSPVWSLDNWGEDLLAMASFDGKLYRWSRSFTQPAAQLINAAPDNCRAMLVTPERHVLVLAPDGEPREVAWSSREDFNDFNFASTTNTAGKLPINTDGLLTAMAAVRDGTLLFSDMEVHLLRYVGLPDVYGSFRIGSEVSLLSANTVATFGGNAVWMGKQGFHIYSGGQAVQALPCEVASYVYADLDEIYTTLRGHASANGIFNEVWWFYTSKDAVARGEFEPDKYVVWNYAENWWSIGELPRTAMYPAGVFPFPLLGSVSRHIYQHEDGTTEAGIPREAGRCFVETGAISAGDGTQVLDALSAQMDTGSGYDRTRLRLTGRFQRDGLTFLEDYFPREDGEMDLRFTARDIRARISNGGPDMDWSIGRFRMDLRPGSQR
jgi:hypothetical protein